MITGCGFCFNKSAPCVAIVTSLEGDEEANICSKCLINKLDKLKIIGFLNIPTDYVNKDDVACYNYDAESYDEYRDIYYKMVIAPEKEKKEEEKIEYKITKAEDFYMKPIDIENFYKEYNEIPRKLEEASKFYFSNEKELYNKKD